MKDRKAGPDPIDIAVGHRVRMRRKLAGCSQQPLAEHLGLTSQQVQKYEHGMNRISASMLVRAAEELKTSVAELLGEGPEAANDVELSTRIATPGAHELLQIYSTGSPRLRHAMLALARALADPDPDLG